MVIDYKIIYRPYADRIYQLVAVNVHLETASRLIKLIDIPLFPETEYEWHMYNGKHK